MDKTSSIDTFIKNSHLFNGLTEVELRHVNRSLKLQAFDKDEVIQRQGNRADALKLIVSGSIRLIMQDDEGISDTLSLAAGETFGEESLFPKDTFVYTAIAEENCTLLRLPRKAMLEGVEESNRFKDNLVFLRGSYTLNKKMRVSWLNTNEKVYCFSQKSLFQLFLKQMGPLFLFLVAFIGTISTTLMAVPALPYVFGGLFILDLAWSFWQYLDWQNDYYIITNQRVIWLEKVIILYDSRSEANLDTILTVSSEMSFFGRMFNYGTVIVRTFSGQIKLKYVNNPNFFASIVEEFIRRKKESASKIDQERIKATLLKKLGKTAPALPPRTPQKPDQNEEESSWWNDLFRMRTDDGSTITYHKHIFGFFRDSFSYVLGLFAIVLFIFFWNIIGYEVPIWFYILLIFSAISMFFIIIYQYWDWKNDIYQITQDQILDIDKKPLGDEDRKAAPLENILSTEYKRNGIFGLLFNFGTVYIKVGNSEFNFEDVADPPSVQQDIIQRQLGNKKRRSDRNSEAESEKISEWLKIYHTQINDSANPIDEEE